MITKAPKTFFVFPEEFNQTPKMSVLVDYVRHTSYLPKWLINSGREHIKYELDNNNYQQFIDECTHLVIYSEDEKLNVKMSEYVLYAILQRLRIFKINPKDFTIEEYFFVEGQGLVNSDTYSQLKNKA